MLKKKTGLSLIEIMIILSILSIAASILIPRYLKHKIHRQQEILETPNTEN